MNIMTASHQWASRPSDQRFQTLDALRGSVHDRRLRSRSTDIDLSAVQVTLVPDTASEKNRLIVNSAIAPSEPSHWSFGQLAGQVKAPASYLRTLPDQLVADNLNYGLRKYGGETTKFMTVSSRDGGTNTLQAVTSPTYGRIWDADVVESVQRVVDRSGGKFHNPLAYDIATGKPTPSGLYASDRDVFMFMIDGGSALEMGERPDGKADVLHRGFYCWNSEVGAKVFGLAAFLFRVVCGNHIIWGAQNFNELIIRHTKGGPARFDAEALPLLMDYANAASAPEVESIKKAQDYLLPADNDKFIDLMKPFDFTRTELAESVATAKKEEGDCRTLWQLVQGLTAYARGYDYIDARVDLEKRAGKLMQLVA